MAIVVKYGNSISRSDTQFFKTAGKPVCELLGTVIRHEIPIYLSGLGRSTTPEEEVLLVGHYDTISNAPDPATLAPGADDNGTGIAAIVEAARHLAGARYERTVKFVCFSGEEIGLLGSAAYAARAESLGTPIAGVFNLDCVGWNDDYFRIFSNGALRPRASSWVGFTS